MKYLLTLLAGALLCCFSATAQAQGTINIALSQQFSFTGCSTAANVCGTPLIGGLLYFFATGTVSTRQDSFQDTGLTIPNPWPLQLDANGRVPMFYLASGSVHVRLTDAAGVVQFDYPSMLVVGPAGGGGGGAGVDPSTIASTGDIKFRMTGEVLSGWLRLNGQTFGNVGAAGAALASANYQALYVYLWNNCPNTHCPVTGGRGSTGLCDFGVGSGCGTPKAMQLPDWRGRIPVGLDDMGNTRANRLPDANVTSGGGDTATTPNAWGGQANHTMALADLVGHTHSVSVSTSGSVTVTSLSATAALTSLANIGVSVSGSLSGALPDHTHNYNGFAGTGGAYPGGSVFSGAGAAAAATTGVVGGPGSVTVSGGLSGSGSCGASCGSGTVTGTGTGTFSGTGTGTAATPPGATATPFNVMNPFILGSYYIKW